MNVVIPQAPEVFGGLPHYLTVAVEAASSYGNTVTVKELCSYPEQAELRKLFKHSGPNSAAFESWCFEQWFVFREWMREHPAVPAAFKGESDVLILEDLEKFSLGEFLCTTPSPSAFVSKEGSEFICDTIMRALREGKMEEKCAPQHIADHHFLMPIMRGLGQPTLELEGSLRIDGNLMLAYDAGLYQDHKDIIFSGGRAFYFKDGETIQLATLHCWGRAKKLMADIWQQVQRSAAQSAPPVRLTF